ncbi:unnamed protein product [Ceutorhynchus assimilis]|uniref:Aminopeptidase n=1 Tax=Ceutorhynchus assimilis TaxID=467358 RepID=A0A9P0GQ85_9CUCU|nr:unnamed protein product [Ceutorhynchus assimilis]
MGYHLPIFLISVIVTIATTNGYNLSDYRLPKYAVPASSYYNFDLRNPEEDTFRAESWHQVVILEPNTYELVLNVDPNYVNMDSMHIETNTATFICKLDDYSAETKLMALACIYDLYNENFTFPTSLDFTYTANFSDEPYGLYKKKFKVNGHESYVLFTQFEPTSFRSVFPSFDEPDFKAPISITVDHYQNLTIVGNMDFIDSHGFLQTSNMSDYLVALVAGPNDTWTSYTSTANETYTFSVFAQRIYEEYVSFTLENAPKLIDLMGSWTNLPYETLGNFKMTFAALPGMSGAMENWGLITYDETYIIDEGQKTALKYTIKAVTVMAHEISHQWFGDYVTLDWWSEAWLNEGFASYFEWHLPNLLLADYEFDKMFLVEEFQPALQGDSPSMMPLSNDESKVNTIDEINAEFDSVITYNKGGSVLRMISNALGEDVFQLGIQNYLKDNALGNVNASNFIEHLQAALPNTTDIDLKTYLDSWIYEPGYPIVKTSIEETHLDSDIVSINAYKFQPSLNDTERELSIWWVPLTYVTSDNPTVSTKWIRPTQTFGYSIPKSDDAWGLVNVHATGFYRVDYDVKSLAKIFKVLNNPDNYTQIPVLNRAQLIDDLFNIAKYYTEKEQRYESRPYQNAFSFVEYLKHEQEYYPWSTYLKEVQYLLDMITDETTLQTLKADVLELISSQLIIPNNTNSQDVSPPEILKRSLLLEWACKLGHKDAIDYVKTQFASYQADSGSVDNNYRDVIICYGFQNANSEYHASLMALYETATLPQEQTDIIVGHTCVSDVGILVKVLASTLVDDSPIEQHYWAPMYSALIKRGSIGVEAALRFILENSDAIMQKWKKPMNIEKMISSAASNAKSEHMAMLTQLLNKFGKDSKIGKIIVKGLANIESKALWLEKFGEEITSILVFGGSTVPTTPSTSTTTISTTTSSTSTSTTPRSNNGSNTARSSTGIVFLVLCSMLIFFK